MTKWGVNWVIVMNYLFFDMNNHTLLYQFFRRLRRGMRDRETEETEET